ncbi:hypothetical protein HZY91_05465 [Facklamia sp. DSM 111018]|uniref:DUF624 domain-containing protein n=1 Tax=Facklamia lactis TaxID=2749967 RepID=A0ABS0LSM4_9LACT|nr:hypothetical protein [Facklamia lactis]MBG9986341.1 hypothetical protein [Facklamia lactis]
MIFSKKDLSKVFNLFFIRIYQMLALQFLFLIRVIFFWKLVTLFRALIASVLEVIEGFSNTEGIKELFNQQVKFFQKQFFRFDWLISIIIELAFLNCLLFIGKIEWGTMAIGFLMMALLIVMLTIVQQTILIKKHHHLYSLMISYYLLLKKWHRLILAILLIMGVLYILFKIGIIYLVFLGMPLTTYILVSCLMKDQVIPVV